MAILPKVPSKQYLVDEMNRAGIDIRIVTPPNTFAVKALRERLSMTQEQFSVLYGVELRTLQKYENGERNPDRTTIGYFKLIEKAPEELKRLRMD